MTLREPVWCCIALERLTYAGPWAIMRKHDRGRCIVRAGGKGVVPHTTEREFYSNKCAVVAYKEPNRYFSPEGIQVGYGHPNIPHAMTYEAELVATIVCLHWLLGYPTPQWNSASGDKTPKSILGKENEQTASHAIPSHEE